MHKLHFAVFFRVFTGCTHRMNTWWKLSGGKCLEAIVLLSCVASPLSENRFKPRHIPHHLKLMNSNPHLPKSPSWSHITVCHNFKHHSVAHLPTYVCTYVVVRWLTGAHMYVYSEHTQLGAFPWHSVLSYRYATLSGRSCWYQWAPGA